MGEINRVLTHGGVTIFETPNPDNFHVATSAFYKDPTHNKPIPKELTGHLLQYHGFEDIKTHPMHPFPETMHIFEDSEVARRFNQKTL